MHYLQELTINYVFSYHLHVSGNQLTSPALTASLCSRPRCPTSIKSPFETHSFSTCLRPSSWSFPANLLFFPVPYPNEWCYYPVSVYYSCCLPFPHHQTSFTPKACLCHLQNVFQNNPYSISIAITLIRAAIMFSLFYGTSYFFTLISQPHSFHTLQPISHVMAFHKTCQWLPIDHRKMPKILNVMWQRLPFHNLHNLPSSLQKYY